MVNRSQKSNQHQPSAENAPRIIKKYPNRRLYDTSVSSYVTLSEVRKLVIEEVEVVVVDAKSQEDITRGILLQIILDEEMGALPMFSNPALVNMIRFYGQLMQGFMGSYLEKNMQNFLDLQAEVADLKHAVSAESWQNLIDANSAAPKKLLQSFSDKSRQALELLQLQMEQQTNQLIESLRIKTKK